jgi:hypothetical protein
MGLYMNHRGRSSLFLLIFLGFIIYGLVSTRWDASYATNWNNLGSSSVKLTTGTVVPYIKPTGDVNGDQYPDELIYDSFEKAIWIQELSGWTFDTEEQLINTAINLVTSSDRFNTYGRCSMGIHTINGKAEVPEYIWSKTFSDRDIMHAEMIQDITGDGIQEVLVSYGFVSPFPTEEYLRNIISNPFADYYQLLKTYFEAPNSDFQKYFTIDNSSTHLVVTPNYFDYELWVFNGNNGSLICREQPDGVFNLDRCVLDVVSLNRTHSTLPPILSDIVIVTSNYSAPRFYSPIYYKNYDLGHNNISFANWTLYLQSYMNATYVDFDFRVHGIHIDPFEECWSSSYRAFLPQNRISIVPKNIGFDLIPYVNLDILEVSMNVSLRIARTVELESFGENFILKYTTIDGLSEEGDGDAWLIPGLKPVTIFAVHNGETGQRLWYGNSSYLWLSKNLDIDGDGFGQINSVYSVENSHELTIAYNNPQNGVIISKAILTYDPTRLLNYNNTDAMWCTISDDDKIGNDGVFEVIMLGLNKSHYNSAKNPDYMAQPDPIQFARLNLNFSSQIHMLLSPVCDFRLNLFNYTNRMELMSMGQDFDGDGWKDYFFFTYNAQSARTTDISYLNMRNAPLEAALISGKGIQLYQRNVFAFFSTHMELQRGLTSGYDLRTGYEIIHFFADPINPNRISSISGTWNSYIYVQDINTFTPNIDFIEFFEGADILLWCLIGAACICVIGIATGIKTNKKRSKVEDLSQTNEADKVQSQINDLIDSKMMKSAGNFWYYTMFFMILAIVLFFTRATKLIIGYTDVVISPEGQLIWFLIMYPAIFGLLVLIPELYSSTAPFFAEKVFINAQRAVFSYFQKTQRKDYKVIVVNMDERRYVSMVTRISRLLLPLLISFTIGTAIYQGLGPNGALYELLEPFGIIDHALTNPDALGIITEDMTDVRNLWVEIGSFARYCIVPMIITYIATTVIIPGAWLLDDAGVCFYQKALKFREVSDIDSVSKWILSVISGLFGFTAIVSFFSLFAPMLSQIKSLTESLGILSDVNPFLGVIILIVALIVFPIVSGILLMYGSMYMMEKNYVKNVRKIYQRMEKNGIDATPLEMSYILAARQDRWFEQGSLGFLRSFNKVKSKDIKKETPNKAE